MSTDAGGTGMPGPPPPGYGPAYSYGPAYGPPYGYAVPRYGYPPPPGYGPPPLKPGVIPLRPLGLSDIFNGAITYIRANPKSTLGLTTLVVVVTQLVALIVSVGPLTASGRLTAALAGEEPSTGMLVGSTLSGLAGAVATGLASILLSGLLTVVVGRAVFGAPITIGQAWQRLRGRLGALIVFTIAEVVGAALLIAAVVGLIVWIAYAAGGAAAAVIGIPLALGLIAVLVYLGTMLTFAPPIIVLERLGVVAAVQRSFKLVKRDFWRVLGIRLLAMIVAEFVAAAVAVPFSLGGQILLSSAESAATTVLAMVVLTVGSSIGQIISAPFSAGVVVLQYTDGRIRSEAFDLVLRTGVQTGAAYGVQAPSDSTDHLWLTGRR